MDFDFGNLVYILITLAFVIFSAMKSRKKPQAQPIKQEPANETIRSPKSEDYLSEKLKNLFGDYIDLGVPVQETEEEIEESIYGYVDNDYETPNLEYEEVLDSNISKLDTIDAEEGLSTTMQYIKDLEAKNLVTDSQIYNTGLSFTDEVLKDFDPRRAILFSEVFRPKYF